MTACFSTRIGYVVSHFPPASDQRLLDELAELERSGLNVRVFALERSPLDAQPGDPARRPRVTYMPARVDRDSSHAEAEWLASQVVARGITHLHAYSMDRATDIARAVAAIAEIPYSFSVETDDLTPQHLRARELRTRARAAQFIITRSAASLGILAEICGHGVIPKCHWMYEGIDLAQLPFFSEVRRTDALLAVVGPPGDTGLDDALAATAILHARGRKVYLTVVAPEEAHASVQRETSRRGLTDLVRIVEPPDQHALQGLMRLHTLLLAPWRTTATPAEVPDIFLKAMALGLPIVASDVPGLREAIDDGWTGRLVRAGDPIWLAGAIETLLDQSRVRQPDGARGS
jgi:glycosyltransferase involved in cell wall biosynthesis